MKTTENNPRAIKTIQIITLIFNLQINFLFAANPIESVQENYSSICIICSNSASSTETEILLNNIISLTPTTPSEATFTDEANYSEINLSPTAPAEATFEDDPGFMNTSTGNFECLAPKTPAEADFND
jgi:hypothetical protein